ncbi:MAG: hypothetical protein GYA55_01740 [SAR324 cluster bacterium]|uniref:Uncharacterized protein n=1 Tax=SAR324 cluster bacterium TaxID=2024889 RepID=A0A7X9IIR3_9DELT|nr:hypothetical protein [SAR324 cluster bacterium]
MPTIFDPSNSPNKHHPTPSSVYLSPIPDLKKVEVHIIIGCSDSRDLSRAFNQSCEALIMEELEQGKLVELHRESAAGTFITPDIVESIRNTINDRIQAHQVHIKAGLPIELFVHVMAHGNVRLRDCVSANPALNGTIHAVEMVPNSPTNCGMMHAEDVAEELELQLLTEQPTLNMLNIGGKPETKQIKTESDIKYFMERVYKQHSLIAAGWVKSIVDLRRHACEQKLVLRDALNQDASLRNIRINITAGVQNYEDHFYYRVDSNFHLGPTFVDRIYKRMKSGPIPDAAQQVCKQKPMIGLFHHSGISNARATAIALHSKTSFQAGQVFSIGSSMIGDISRPFGAYQVVGYYYGVKHLNLDQWVVMGRDELETERIMMRIHNDPLIGYITERFNVRLLPMPSKGMNNQELRQFNLADC